MKKLLFIFIALIALSAQSWAYDFSYTYQGQTLYYSIVGGNAEVTYQDSYTNLTGSLTIPSSVTYNGTTYSVTSIGIYAFRNCSGLTSVTIPNSVTSIGNYAFRNCSGLTSVTIPNSVTSIGNSAFASCSELTSVTIGNSVTSIGNEAFYSCSGLTSVTIPNSVTSIGIGAFGQCTNLTSVYIHDIATWCNIEFEWTNSYYNDYSNPLYYAHNLYINGNLVTDLVIPNGVTQIKSYAFYNATCLTSVTIPTSVTSIGEYAFAYCSGLCGSALAIPNSVTSIGNNAFYDVQAISYSGSATGSPWGAQSVGGFVDGYLTYSDMTKTVVTGCCPSAVEIIIPNTVTSIGERAFFSSGLTSVTIPNSVTSIGDWAFCSCSWLTTVNFNATNCTSMGSQSYPCFYGCTSLTTLNIGDNVTNIPSFAFSGCSGLTSVTIPNSVTSIGNYAFSGCSGLTSVTIPNSVTSIGNYAFGNCSGLTSVTIPNSVTSIGDFAFYGCTGLTEIRSLNPVPPTAGSTIGGTFNSAFYGIPTNIPVYIPCGCLSNYTGAEGWSQFSNYNFIESSIISFSAVSDNNTMGTVQVLTMPSCSNAQAVVQAVANSGYQFVHWSDGSTDNPYTLTVNVSMELTAHFLPCYTMTVTSNDNEMGTVSGGGTHIEDSTVSITATANYGYHFVQWNDGNTDNPRTITLTSDTSFTAFFATNQYTVTGVSQDNNMGSVTGTATVDYLGTVTLSANANYGYHFDHWQVSGSNEEFYNNPINIVADADKTVTAYFAINQYSITVTSNNSSRGTVSGSGVYDYLSERTITATSNFGYHFSQWNDGNTDNPRIVTLTRDTLFTALFVPNQYTLTLQSGDEQHGSVNGGGVYDYLDTITISATAVEHYHFVSWNDDNIDNPRRYVITGDASLTASFAIDVHTVSVAVDDISHGSVQASGTSFIYGDPCTVTATAYSGYTFDHWSNGMSANPYTFAVLNDMDLIAYFVPSGSQPTTYYTITAVSANVSMGSVTGGGSYPSGTTATLTANANSGYRFDHWQDGNTTNPRTITVTGNATYTAYFSATTTYYTITAIPNDVTMGSVTGGGSYASGTTATLTANPNSGYHFDHWQDGNTSNPRTITVSSDATYTAYFDVDQTSTNAPSIACVGVDLNNHNVVRWAPREGVTSVMRYNIYREGLGGYSIVGYVLYNGAADYSWVDDNSNTASQTYSYKISEVYNNGTESDLSAPHTTMHLQISQGQGNTWNLSWTPYVGFNYDGYRIFRGTTAGSMSLLTSLSTANTTYSDANGTANTYYQIEVVPSSSAKSITVASRSNIASAAAPTTYTLTVASANNTMGTASGGGTYQPGMQATITATALDGYRFVNWSDGSTHASRTITVTGDATYIAYFEVDQGGEPQQYVITVVSVDENMGTVIGGGMFEEGTVTTIMATAKPSYQFVQWQDGNTQDIRTITVTANATYTAFFRADGTQGIDDITAEEVKVHVRGSEIVVEGAENTDALIYDVMGRIVHKGRIESPIRVNNMGVYMVKIGERQPRKVVVR